MSKVGSGEVSPIFRLPQADRHHVHIARREILIEAHAGGDVYPIENVIEDRSRTLAAFMLVHEGFAEMNPEQPDQLRLTEQGLKWAMGATALSKG